MTIKGNILDSGRFDVRLSDWMKNRKVCIYLSWGSLIFLGATTRKQDSSAMPIVTWDFHERKDPHRGEYPCQYLWWHPWAVRRPSSALWRSWVSWWSQLSVPRGLRWQVIDALSSLARTSLRYLLDQMLKNFIKESKNEIFYPCCILSRTMHRIYINI